MPPNVSRDPSRASRRLAIAVAVVVLSLLLHLSLLAWLDERLASPGTAGRPPETPVEVALIARAPLAPEAPPAVPAEPSPVSRPARVRAAPARRPGAITPPPQSAVALEPAPAAEPLAQAATLPGDAVVAPEDHAASPAVAGAFRESAAPETPASTRDDIAADGASAPRHGTPLPLPPSGRWTFGVFYGDYADRHRVASLEWSIAHDGHRYALRTAGRAEGLTALVYSGVLSQGSSGRLSDEGLLPERYVEQRGQRPERWAMVDAARTQVTFSGNPPVPMQPGAQDRLSVLVQLGLLARAAPQRFAAGQIIEIPELTLRDIEQARYASLGDDTLETADGPIRALRLERIAPRRPDDPKVEVWLGYDRGMLPVRIRLTDPGGRVLDQLVQP